VTIAQIHARAQNASEFPIARFLREFRLLVDDGTRDDEATIKGAVDRLLQFAGIIRTVQRCRYSTAECSSTEKPPGAATSSLTKSLRHERATTAATEAFFVNYRDPIRVVSVISVNERTAVSSFGL
jgi:hypothetical protein